MTVITQQSCTGEHLSIGNGHSGFPALQGKRVGMVVFSHYPGDPRPRRAIDALLSEGMKVDLICLADDENPRRQEVEDLRIWRIPITHRRAGKLAYAYQYSAFIAASGTILAMWCLRNRYDLIYVHNMPDVLVASALAPKARGARVILDLHDPMPELMTTIFNLHPESFSSRLIRALEKWSIRQANMVITVNLECKRIFAERSCPPEKIGVVMNAPDEKIFEFQAVRTSDRPNPTDSKPFVIMYHGSIVERNGLGLAIEALVRVRRVIRSAEIRIYGRNTAFLEHVLADASAKGVRDYVKYLGPRSLEQLVHEIAACDVGVIPNLRNAFTDINTPTRIFEYLALGKPVIAPRTPGIQQYFGPESLLFFEAGKSEELATKIVEVFSRPDATTEVVKKGQAVYRAHTWAQERQMLLNLVSNLLTGSTAANS